ncbi:hypothetical protein FQN54_000004 [Arachnomyces sp. PD_36]|nr:hypothetical protein FQN54_000004 [Arachnomyces sp. PD_36]
MLLPSALHCEARPRPRLYANQTYLTPTPLFPSTPPPSNERIPSSGNGLLGTCRALQSLLNSSPASSPRRAKPQPLQSPVQFRQSPPKQKPNKVKKASPKAPRGVNKRRRDSHEEQGYKMTTSTPSLEEGFVTPKRRRCWPETMPLGLESSDFESLEPTPRHPSHSRVAWIKVRDRQRDERRNVSGSNQELSFNPDFWQLPQPNDPQPDNISDSKNIENTPSNHEDTSDWSADDDQRLIELVLEKLNLSRRDWDECARLMGKDQDSVGRRWKALVGEGNIGLRRGTGIVRGRIDDIWR